MDAASEIYARPRRFAPEQHKRLLNSGGADFVRVERKKMEPIFHQVCEATTQ